MTTGKPRVWVFPFAGNCDDYTLLDADVVPDVLTAKCVLELARPGLGVTFYHVYFMGISKPWDDSYELRGVAAFSDDENMFNHAPDARDIYLRIATVPLTSDEMLLAMKDCSSAAHLTARPPCASATSKAASSTLRRREGDKHSEDDSEVMRISASAAGGSPGDKKLSGKKD